MSTWRLSTIVLSLVLTVAACGDSAADDGGAGSSATAGSGGLAGAGAAGAAGTGGFAGTGAAGAAGTGAAGSAGTMAEEDFVPFEGGTRIYEHVLNLVDEAAADQLEAYLKEEAFSLELAARKFYAYFGDDYDYLFLVPDRELGTQLSAAHNSVRNPAIPGTGIESLPPHLEYYSAARLSAVIPTDFLFDGFPAIHHEVAHRYANHLDPSLGFGKDGAIELGTHWGLTSVFGQLGGFDGSTLRCETPAGALPPACTPLPSGRTRYVMSNYAPNTNSFQGVPYAPLELYLMGLIPKSEVPTSFQVLVDGETDFSTIGDADDEMMAAEASSVGEILLDDIIALHGERTLLPASERHFTSAFVVVSRAPASESVLAQVSRWAEIFGNHVSGPWDSFEEATGGRATLDARLGARRAQADPLVTPDLSHRVAGAACDVIEQDCGAGMACRAFADPFCQAAGSGTQGEACQSGTGCAAGFDCNNGVCIAHCTLLPNHPKNCGTLCPPLRIAYPRTLDDSQYLGGICWQ